MRRWWDRARTFVWLSVGDATAITLGTAFGVLVMHPRTTVDGRDLALIILLEALVICLAWALFRGLALWLLSKRRDRCEVCNGARGGVRGNEQWIDDQLMCDYCHADVAELRRQRGD